MNQRTRDSYYVQLTPRQHLAKSHPLQKKLSDCQRAWCSCSFPQTQAPGLQWGQESLSHTEVERRSPQILFQGIAHCREVFFIQLRKSFDGIQVTTPAWAVRDVDGCAHPLFLPLSWNGYPILKMFPLLESKFLHPLIGLEFMAHKNQNHKKKSKNILEMKNQFRNEKQHLYHHRRSQRSCLATAD